MACAALHLGLHQPATSHRLAPRWRRCCRPAHGAGARPLMRPHSAGICLFCRGEATLSMSCSDKLARWCMLGLQGCLLSGLLEAPLALSTLAVSLCEEGAACDRVAREAAAQRAIERAVSGRTAELRGRLQAPFAWRPPAVAVVPPPPEGLALAPTASRTVPSGQWRVGRKGGGAGGSKQPAGGWGEGCGWLCGGRQRAGELASAARPS